MIMINQNHSVQAVPSYSLSLDEFLLHPSIKDIIASRTHEFEIEDRHEAQSLAYEAICKLFDTTEVKSIEEGLKLSSVYIKNRLKTYQRSERRRFARFTVDERRETDSAETYKESAHEVPDFIGFEPHLWNSLMRLPQKLKDIFLAIELDELSQAKVAEHYNCSRQQIRKYLLKAKQILREDEVLLEIKKHYN